MSEPFLEALLRALFGAIISGGLVVLTVYQQADEWETALVAGGIAALTYLVARGFGEGIADQRKMAATTVVTAAPHATTTTETTTTTTPPVTP